MMNPIHLPSADGLLMGLRPVDRLRATLSQVGQVVQRISSLFHVTWHLGLPRAWLARLALSTGASRPRRGTIPMVTWQSWLRALPRGPVATGTWLTGDLEHLDSLIVRTYFRDGTLALVSLAEALW